MCSDTETIPTFTHGKRESCSDTAPYGTDSSLSMTWSGVGTSARISDVVEVGFRLPESEETCVIQTKLKEAVLFLTRDVGILKNF